MTRFPFSGIFTLLSALFRKAWGADVPVIERIFITGFLWILFIPFAFSQDKEHVDGGHFVKRIEYNLRSRHDRSHNLDSKGKIEKLFFGDFNAEVEFFYLPSEEAAYGEAYSGFRIVRVHRIHPLR
ncbi:MAG: hypothetical protein LBL04_07645 [Bacteroidales bacterium]|nr:hypothetical protein [Bacteroidales bacterium]